MDMVAWVGLGFVGLVSGGFGGAGPIPNGAPTDGEYDARGGHALTGEARAPAGAGIFVPLHKPAHFPFVIIVKDDGKDPAGGWQAAAANLPFQKFDFPITAITWYCSLTIGMPIRHSVRGYISPVSAATMSAAVTNSVASRMNFDLPQGVFCHTFRKGVEAAFPAMFPVGATVGR